MVDMEIQKETMFQILKN